MFFCVVGTAIIRSRYRNGPVLIPTLPGEKPSGVTIIRPLKGLDSNMVENLSSSFRQTYPIFEILFCVADPEDPVIPVVQELIASNSQVDARLFIGCHETGVNPKINNMQHAWEAAQYDIIWIMDSNVSADPGCMQRSVAALSQPQIGLVHHLPCGVRAQTYGSSLEQTFLNTAHAKMYVTINKLAVASCLIGKSNMFRRSDLADVGGLAYFGKYMSEDNIIGEALWAKGLRHAMTTDLAYQTLGSLSARDYFDRRARWIRIRKYTVTVATLTEPLTESIVNGLLAAWSLTVLAPQIPTLPFLAFHFAVWLASDWIIATTLDPATRNTRTAFFKAWVVRELATLPLWIYAMAGSTVEWRGKLFWLNSDGTVQPAGKPWTERCYAYMVQKMRNANSASLASRLK
ncbi:hypothetical protein HKX48_001600 [Thoreauomyces humboldtii]|nr:hypothetical protein HKX48_001600 [Thoreauomyces humboldtii]